MANALHRQQARSRYEQGVRQARIADLWGRIRGDTTDLVRFQDVAQRLGARQQVPRGIQSVPLDRIIGSVGRTRDFTRSFLPRSSVNQERWAGISAVFDAQEGLPPVELFRMGEVYFVRDGHHRISAARASGQLEIEADVVEVQSPVWLTVEDFQRNEWIVKAKQAGEENTMVPLLEIEETTREYQEFSKRFEKQHFAPGPDSSGPDQMVRLLERLGERLIAYGTRLKANSQSVG